ncbi:RsmB/NOP family class I SAM-dependent RNA methyltransferase [Magnetovibrio sp.]|uniref:RsmB/NOP family class I SAM-dependent RNA methyltransferase n=1 Tax=Magnetovibrio sp. TaxID=2024836 RepID=UPI002F934B96
MPRTAALNLLDAVLNHKHQLDDALNQAQGFNRLPERDRALAQQITRTVLRHLGEIDLLISSFLDKPLGKKGLAAQNVMRLGLAQLFFLDTADHAAIDTAVELCRGGDLAPYRKLVNAILRRAQREGAALLADQDVAQLNTPAWLWQSWVASYGEDTAHAIAAQHLVEAPLDITVKDDPAGWAEKLEAHLMPTGTLRLSGHKGVITSLPGFEEGAWWIQDMAASLPARLLGNVCELDVIDLCAAPGGKTMELAAAGARVIAVDRSDKRLERVADNLKRTKLSAKLITADATQWRPDMLADAVLLDAPCSATGTARRHPDVLQLKQPADVTKLAHLQGRLLKSAVDMVRPGGLIVYCTCSLQREEGEAQIQTLLQSGAPVQLDPLQPKEVGTFTDFVTADGFLRTLPCHFAEQGGMDGFFAARLRRL